MCSKGKLSILYLTSSFHAQLALNCTRLFPYPPVRSAAQHHDLHSTLRPTCQTQPINRSPKLHQAREAMEQRRIPGFEQHSKLQVSPRCPPLPLLQPCSVPHCAATRCRDVFCTNTEHVGRPGSADCVTCPESNRPSQDLRPYFKALQSHA